MIKSKIQIEFNHHHSAIQNFKDDIYVADYTEQTKNLPVKRSVEIYSANPPIDIDSFSIKNNSNLSIDGIIFDSSSFVCGNGNTKTQCEAVFFPEDSATDSWILFSELKYNCRPRWNRNNLRKAFKQLYKTRYYYAQENVLDVNNTSYLIASLPMQLEPFPSFSLTPAFLLKLKRRSNIIVKFQNSIDVLDSKTISV